MILFDVAIVLWLTIIWATLFFLTKMIDAQERRIRDLENRK
jgi:hypothetical protein